MNHRWRLLAVLVLLAVALMACRGNDDNEGEVPTLEVLSTATTTAVVVAATDTLPPLPTSTLLPTATIAPPPTETATTVATAAATTQAGAGDQSGQGQDASVAATAGAAAGAAQGLMGPWQGIIGVAVLNQTICTTLQALAQTGQQGGLGSLAVGAGLLGVGGVLQSAQQQLGGLLNTPGVGLLLGSLQADQASLSDLLARWSGGQIDAAAAGAALQVICGSTDATLAQTQQGAQDAGMGEDEVDSIIEDSKRDATDSLDGLLP